MAYEDRFRMSVHAVITNENNEVLMLKANYGTGGWGLPGGALDPTETVHEALIRECREEIGVEILVKELTGIYYYKKHDSQVVIFRAEIVSTTPIRISEEHSEFAFRPLSELTPIARTRIEDCLNFDGFAKSRRFEPIST